MDEEDILSQGGDREPRPRPRRLGVVAAVLLAAVGGVVYLAFPHHQQVAPAAAPAAPPATASPIPSQIVVSGNLAVPGQPPQPDGIIIRTRAWGDSPRLPAGGTRPAWYWPGTGRSESIGGLPADSAGYQFARVGGGWAVQADSGAKIDCVACAGPAMPVWYLADGARSATRVGTANLVAPAAAAGDLWLTSYQAGADVNTAQATAWEAGPTGTVRQRPARLPAGYVIEQGTDRGLLLGPASPQSGATLERLWNPASRSLGRRFGPVLAADATQVAVAPRCALRCGVQVLNLRTGAAIVVRLPAGASPAGASFSPDGSFLALQLGSDDDGALAMQLDVASVASGGLTRVPGTWVSSDALAGFGWPDNSNRLVAEFNFESTMQLTSWQPGASELSLAVMKPGSTQAYLALG